LFWIPDSGRRGGAAPNPDRRVSTGSSQPALIRGRAYFSIYRTPPFPCRAATPAFFSFRFLYDCFSLSQEPGNEEQA
jgi:hypothetical protein